MTFKHIQLLSLVDTSGSVETDSIPILIDQLYGFSVHIIAAGASPAGTLTIQGSNDAGTSQSSPTNWATIGSATTISAAGGTLTNVDGAHFKWVRVKYVANSGTGTVTVNFAAKGP